MEKTVETQNNPLLHLQDKAIRAHNWTSFHPEKRGEQMVKDYGNELNGDLEELRGDDMMTERMKSAQKQLGQAFAFALSVREGEDGSLVIDKDKRQELGKAYTPQQ